MFEIDAAGLQYLTRDAYPEIYRDIAGYNRQARWVNSGAKQLAATDIAAILVLLQTLSVKVRSVSEDESVSTPIREEAGGLLAGIQYAIDNLNNPAPTMRFEDDPNATYTEEAYFNS